MVPTSGLRSCIEVSYRVDNLAGGSAAQMPWTDSIYISADNVFDVGDRLLSERTIEGSLLPLPAGMYRLQNERLTVPTGYAAGSSYLLLRTNSDRRLGEGTSKNRNRV